MKQSSKPGETFSSEEIHCRILEVQASLLTLAYNLCHEQNAANDLLQETTLHILLNIEKYRESSTFTAWACEIMSNIFKNNRRQASRHKRIIQQGYIMHLYDGCGTLAEETAAYNHTTGSESSYNTKEVLKIISHLPCRQREVMTLRINGYKYHEIAHKAGTTMNNVKNCLFQARANIKRMMKR